MTLLEKILALVLLAAITVTLCIAANLTNIHGTVTIAFGKAPPAPTTIIMREAANPAEIATAIQLPVSALGRMKR